MGNKRNMQRVHAPGLPPWPRLYYDATRRRALVTARHATWRSQEQALRAVAGGSLIAGIAAGCWVLWGAEWFEQSGEGTLQRILVGIVATGVVWLVVGVLLRDLLSGFLARRVFATRLTGWFTPQAIALRTQRYDRPVVVWRRPGGSPVELRFIVQQDIDANRYAGSLARDRKAPTHHLRESALLCVLVSQSGGPHLQQRGQAASRRSIPVTEVCQSLAPKLTAVLETAAQLTRKAPGRASKNNTGVSIDNL